MQTAREVGITFLDDARYNDETGHAPIPTGYSEVIFGELFRATGWVRDEVVVANKLWWEFWPDQDAAGELDASLQRMGLDHVDLIYTMQPPDGLTIEALVEQVAAVVASGRARSWGIGNWPADQLVDAVRAARQLGVVLPCAAQLPYSLVRADWVQDPVMEGVLADADIGLVASYVLAGGTLTGKYLQGETGRSETDETPAVVAGKHRAAALVELAREWDVPPAALGVSVRARPSPAGQRAVRRYVAGATPPERRLTRRVRLPHRRPAPAVGGTGRHVRQMHSRRGNWVQERHGNHPTRRWLADRSSDSTAPSWRRRR